MKYMTMCGDVRIKIIPVINTEDIEMSSIAYKEVQKLVTYTFGLLDCIIEKDVTLLPHPDSPTTPTILFLGILLSLY